MSEEEKEKLEALIEKKMSELDDLNEKLLDENQQYNWIEYKQIHDEIKEKEEEIDDLMRKLEKLDI